MEKIPKSDWLEEKRLLSNADWHIGAGSRYTDVLGPRTPPELRVPESLSKLLSLGFVGEGRPNFDVKGNLRWILTDVLDRIPANASVVLMAERDDAMSAVLSEMYELLGHPKLRAIYTTAIESPKHRHPKVRLRPIGLPAYFERALRLADYSGNKSRPRQQKVFSLNISGQGLLLAAFSTDTNSKEREPLHRQCSGSWRRFCHWGCLANGLCISSVALHRCKKIGFKVADLCTDLLMGAGYFYSLVSRFSFVLAPSGFAVGGGEEPGGNKVWEALYHGSVPIVIRGHASELFSGLPVLEISSWSHLSKNILCQAHALLQPLIAQSPPAQLRASYWTTRARLELLA